MYSAGRQLERLLRSIHPSPTSTPPHRHLDIGMGGNPHTRTIARVCGVQQCETRTVGASYQGTPSRCSRYSSPRSHSRTYVATSPPSRRSLLSATLALGEVDE